MVDLPDENKRTGAREGGSRTIDPSKKPSEKKDKPKPKKDAEGGDN